MVFVGNCFKVGFFILLLFLGAKRVFFREQSCFLIVSKPWIAYLNFTTIS